MENNEMQSENVFFDKKDLSDNKKIIFDLEEFNNSLFNCFMDTRAQDIDFVQEKSSIESSDCMLSEICSDTFKKIIDLKKQRLSDCGLKCINNVEVDKKISLDGNFNISKDRTKSIVTINIPGQISEKYEISGTCIYKSSVRAKFEYSLDYQNESAFGKVKAFNIKKEKSSRNSIWKYVGVAILISLFVIGTIRNLNVINGKMFILYIFLVLFFSVLIIKFFPVTRIVEKKKKKTVFIKNTDNSIFLLRMLRDNPLYQLSDFYMEIDYKIKGIHYASSEEDLKYLSVDADLWDILQKYKNVIDCNTIKYNIVNYTSNSEKNIINFFFKLELKEISYNDNIDYASVKRSKEIGNIIIREEDVLVKAEMKRNKNENLTLVIKDYKIM